ncbi:hypothetical protein FHU10_0077 [Serratia fonticola]|jgi:hypothetical protein|uniref:Uncharacterized protein n=1 Tax=Serratia fonticola TaxID=47917 RepID=A0A542BML1_SERFO|nr:hypothetical protein FHU09_2372 [Serratia fonticola]TQI98153.1 hypothetical protein FHU11_3675 [Serratia fonticola]TVZ67681.1 hypothetical protein FHU10_0077 [Serratia fonticola]
MNVICSVFTKFIRYLLLLSLKIQYVKFYFFPNIFNLLIIFFIAYWLMGKQIVFHPCVVNVLSANIGVYFSPKEIGLADEWLRS